MHAGCNSYTESTEIFQRIQIKNGSGDWKGENKTVGK